MTEKRFTLAYADYDWWAICDKENPTELGISGEDVVELLNELYEEKEDWEHNCLKTISENSILWNEISILQEQGAEPSDAFKNYLNNLKNKNKKMQGDLE